MTTIENVTKAMGKMFDEGCIVDIRASDRFEGGFTFNVIESGNKKSYLVFPSEDTRDKAVGDCIHDSIELFNPSFLRPYLVAKLPDTAIEAICNTNEANKIIHDLVEDFDALIDDTINSDGSGNYLAPYDHIEMSTDYEDVTYYYYRTD